MKKLALIALSVILLTSLGSGEPYGVPINRIKFIESHPTQNHTVIETLDYKVHVKESVEEVIRLCQEVENKNITNRSKLLNKRSRFLSSIDGLKGLTIGK